MDQQRIALVKHYQMFQLSAVVPIVCPRPKSSLINHFNQSLNDRLGSHRLGAIIEVWRLATKLHGALARCTSKTQAGLSWFGFPSLII